MTRLFTTGLEPGHMGVFSTTVGVLDADFCISAAQVRTGGYSLYRLHTAWGQKSAIIGIPSNPDSLYVRFGFYYTIGSPHLILFCDAAGSRQCYLDINGGTGILRAWLMGGPLLDAGSPVLQNVWVCYEVFVTIANAGGRFVVKRDGITDIDFTGDTQTSGLANIGAVALGWDDAGAGYYDDIAVNDTTGANNNSWIGQGGVVGLKPMGPGTDAEWTPSAGANWQCVDEVPPSDADYIETAVLNEHDLYEMEDMPAGNYRVDAVVWWARAKLDEAGDSYIARLMRQDAADYVGADQGLDINYTYESENMDLAPDATAWTPAKINAIEAGVKAT